jgi:TRAP-type C4-dicarboxylate transport system permease small subunit
MPEKTMEENQKTGQDLVKEKEPILLSEERSLKPMCFFDKVAVNFFGIVTVFCSLALSTLIAAAAFTRYVIRGDLFGYEEWVKLIAFWLYFMGGAYGAYNNTHVSADLIDAYVKGKPRQIMTFFRQLITSAMSILFVYFGYYFFMFGLLGPLPKDNILIVKWNGVDLSFDFLNLWTLKAIARTTVWQIPLWTSYAAIFLGLIFMAIYFSRRCINTGIALLMGKER